MRSDWRDEQHFVPVIVEKCIDAVDLLGKNTHVWYVSSNNLLNHCVL